MTIPAVVFKRGKTWEKLELGVEDCARTPPGTVVAIEHGADKELLRRREDFRDCGLRDERKPLKYYLLHLPPRPVPVLRTDYAQAGRLISSVERLLRQAAEAGAELACVLTVSKALFSGFGPDAPAGGAPVPEFVRLFGFDDRDALLADRVLGGSSLMAEARQKILKAADSRVPVLITGATGSGKTMVARLIHLFSDRRGQFYEKNVAAIPSELLEAELFGNEGGIITNAPHMRKGLWEVADGGTLFLDEIGDLRLDHQAKILHAIQKGAFFRIGGTRQIEVDVRVVAATNRPLEPMMREGSFRADLYYRLSGFNIDMPALDDRPEDVALMAGRFWARLAGNAAPLSGDVVAYLQSVRWPGGARLLKRALEVLHSYVPQRMAPTVEQVEYVLRSMIPALPPARGDGLPRDGASRYLNDCIAHLRRFDAAMAAVSATLSHLSGGSPARGEQRRIRLKVAAGLADIDSLCCTPLLFYDSGLVAIARRLAAALREVPSTAGGDPAGYCRLTLAPLLERAVAATFEVTHNILVKLSSLPSAQPVQNTQLR